MADSLLFPSFSHPAPVFSLGEDLLQAIAALQEQEVALRLTLVADSWEAAYHTGIRIELAGAAFHVLTSLPLLAPPATFLAATHSQLQDRLSTLQAASEEPYTGLIHGHLDAVQELIDLVGTFLELRLDSPTA